MGLKMADRDNSGRFIKGHNGLKKKGTKHRLKDIKTEALALAKNIGGKQGLAGFLRDNPKLHADLVLAAARDKAAVDAAGNPVAPVVYQNNLVILMTPHNMCSIPDSLGGGYCCRALVRVLIAAERAGTLNPFQASEDDAGDPPLTKAELYQVPQRAFAVPDVIPFHGGRRRADDDDSTPPAA
jgi:hypothetical protein